jgi:hypothetical protein
VRLKGIFNVFTRVLGGGRESVCSRACREVLAELRMQQSAVLQHCWGLLQHAAVVPACSPRLAALQLPRRQAQQWTASGELHKGDTGGFEVDAWE